MNCNKQEIENLQNRIKFLEQENASLKLKLDNDSNKKNPWILTRKERERRNHALRNPKPGQFTCLLTTKRSINFSDY